MHVYIYVYIYIHTLQTRMCVYIRMCAYWRYMCDTWYILYIYILCVAISHHFAIAYLCSVPYNELETTAPSCAAVLLGESG